MHNKIAFVSHSYIEAATRTKLLFMAKQENVCLITPNRYPTPYGWRDLEIVEDDQLQVLSYPIHFLHVKRTATRWFLRSRDLGFATLRPEIIHVEMEPHGWITCQALLYRRRFAPKAKVVVFTWENLTLQEQGMKARLLEYISLYNRQLVDFFICGNRAGRNILLAKGISNDRLDVMPQWGVDPEMFYPYPAERREMCRVRLGLSPTDFAIGFVGRLVEEKGILDLVQVVGKLAGRHKQTPTVVLVGRGNLEEPVRSCCAELRVKLVSVPPRAFRDVADIMNALDVLVLPSQSRPFWKEQFGHVLIEAMACGLPVIGSDSGAIPEVIGDAGFVFRERDSEQLFACLQSCMESESLRLNLRLKGVRRVLDNFTNAVIADRTIQIYRRLSSPVDGERIATRNSVLAPMSGV